MATSGQAGGGFLPKSPQPKRRRLREPDRVRDLIASVVKRSGLGADTKLDTLRRCWREAVGRKNAAQTQLVGLKAGVLRVDVSTSVLTHELEVYYKADLIRRLREQSKLPIQDIRFRVVGSFGPTQTGDSGL